MKIAYLLGALERGGTETLILDCFKNNKDVDFSMIGVYRHEGDLSNDFKNTAVSCFNLKPKTIFDFFYFWKLRKLLKAKQITIVHAQLPLDAFYAYLACYGTGIKVVTTFHGYDFKQKKISYLINKFIIKYAN